MAGGPYPDPSLLRFGLGTGTTRCSPACTTRRRWWRARPWRRPARCGPARVQHGASIAGGLHHAMRGERERVLRVQRPGDRDRVAAGAGRGAGRLRRHRRAPRRRRAGGVLHRSAGADDQHPRDPAALFPGTGCRPRPEGRARRDRPPTWRCPPGPGTPAGCARSTPSSPRWCARSGRLSWSASMAATRTGSTRWPICELSIDAQRAAHAAIHALAHQAAGGRWLLTGGGGYDLLQVVPRTWAHLLAEAAGHPIDPGARIPAAWRELRVPPHRPPGARVHDRRERARYARFESGYDPAEPLDQAIMATRAAVFPEHGMTPLP